MRTLLLSLIWFTPFLLFAPSLCLAGELDDMIAQLGADDFEAREKAHLTLLESISTTARPDKAGPESEESFEEKLMDAYKDPDVDPESRVRLLNVLEHSFRGSVFEPKNGFIGIGIDNGGVLIHEGKRLSSVRVSHVMPNHQGDKAGLEVFDRIFMIDGKPFETADVTTEFMKVIGFTVPGETVKLSVRRGANQDLEMDCELMKRPADTRPGVYNEEEDFKAGFKDWMKENGLRP